MKWDQGRLTSFRKVVAELYPRESDQRRLVKSAELREAAVQFDASADNSWFFILDYANKQERIHVLADLILEEQPDNEVLRTIKKQGSVVMPTGPDMKSSVSWKGPRNARPLLEKITGTRSALVPVSFLAVGLRRARAVAKVLLPSGASGSGFLTKGNILITNNHVLPTRDSAKSAVAQFNYQQTAAGTEEPAAPLMLDPDAFFTTSEEDDWTAVRVVGDAEKEWGALELCRAKFEGEDRVNIIQHPGGGHKQLSYFSNLVVYVGDGRVQYLTDTLPGSSGSPVFDRNWRVVALHHSGGWLMEPGSDGKEAFYRNEGILVDVIMDGLQKALKDAGRS